MRDGTTALYRFFGADDTLLYVGISMHLPERLATHKDAPHYGRWTQIARIELTWYDTWQAALDAENDAIDDEDPLWNNYGRKRRWAYSKWHDVAAWMTDQIINDRWKPGDRLPPATTISGWYERVAPCTIRIAIKNLIDTGVLRGKLGKGVFVAEGWIEGRQGEGRFVSERPPA